MNFLLFVLFFSLSYVYASSEEDHNENLDASIRDIQFLVTQYGHRTDVIHESNKVLSPEKPTLEEDLGEDLIQGENPIKTYFKILKSTLKFSIFDKRIDEYEKYIRQSPTSFHNMIVSSKRDVRDYFLAKPSSGMNQFLKMHQSDTNRTFIEDIVIGAWNIRTILNEHGQAPILFVGRSGCLVQLALEMLNECEEGEKYALYHINFSGTPDVINVRTNHISQNWIKTLAKNFVTQKKRDYFMRYCDDQHLNEIHDTLYLADIIGTGASLNSIIRILNYYYTQHLERQTPPEYRFLGLSLRYIDDVEDTQNLWSFDAKDERLTFDGDEFLGILPFSLKAYSVGLSYGVANELLDNPFFQDYIVSGTQFPAQKWEDYSLSERQQGGFFWKEAYAMLRIMMAEIIQSHQKDLEHFES